MTPAVKALVEALTTLSKGGSQVIDADPCDWCGNRRDRDLSPHASYCPVTVAQHALSQWSQRPPLSHDANLVNWFADGTGLGKVVAGAVLDDLGASLLGAPTATTVPATADDSTEPATPVTPEAPRAEPLYPCARPGCKVMRTRAQGGATFTVCDEHWPSVAPVTPEAPAVGASAMRPGQRCTRYEHPSSTPHLWDPEIAATWHKRAAVGSRCPFVVPAASQPSTATPGAPPPLEPALLFAHRMTFCLKAWPACANDRKHQDDVHALAHIVELRDAQRATWAPPMKLSDDEFWAVRLLEDMAERWVSTPTWHEPPFHGGKINVTTADLHAASIVCKLIARLRATEAPTQATGPAPVVPTVPARPKSDGHERLLFENISQAELVIGTAKAMGLDLNPFAKELAAAIDELAKRVCLGCGKYLELRNARIADGCPCNSKRGVNHGRVPRETCTCVECDPEQTGSTRYPAVPTVPVCATWCGVSPACYGQFSHSSGERRWCSQACADAGRPLNPGPGR